ncbi:MAG: DUF177 domain-containing protein [Anaerolineaceae bacterium]|nr:DUF177 domain-containing protein [Anaerolineaceae bacterium]
MNSAHSRQPLRINVGFLINQPIGVSRDMQFDFPELCLQPDLDLQNFKGSVRITRTPQGLLVQGNFDATLNSECVRCLAEFLQPLSVAFSELYAFKFKAVTESNLILPEDGNIDLGPLVREYLLLEMPLRPLCKANCKGLCVVCGADLNEGLCEHNSALAE